MSLSLASPTSSKRDEECLGGWENVTVRFDWSMPISNDGFQMHFVLETTGIFSDVSSITRMSYPVVCVCVLRIMNSWSSIEE